MITNLQPLTRLIRHLILTSTTTAGSGHPSSSLSGVELMTTLMFNGNFFHFDLQHPENPNNDRLIFSKGHASPLFYALWAVATQKQGNKETEKQRDSLIAVDELMTLRKFGSRIEGHPTMAFPYTEAATGSLGQGLSVGVGMAINAKYLDKLSYRTYVLLGDSELAEGSVWEAAALGAHYKLDNLIAIADINRLGQRGETMYGHDLAGYQKKFEAFGWETILVGDGHSLEQCVQAFAKAMTVKDKPAIIIAHTLKGKGVSFMENKDGWHGKPVPKDQLEDAFKELGEVDMEVRGEISSPQETRNKKQETNIQYSIPHIQYSADDKIATRKAYGNALARIGKHNPQVVVLDAETSNSTFAEMFKKEYPDRFFEMFIAEQNMVGTALGLSRREKIPFVSTFAAFFTRAADQIRMAQYSGANIKFVGSHVGVSIGEDGASQMGLEDISLFRAIHGSVVLYPSDAISTERLVDEAAKHQGMVYIRTTRAETPILYSENETFPIGGSKVLRQSDNDAVTVFAAGITLHEALKAHDELKKEGISIRVVDMYSIKPLDTNVIAQACKDTKALIVVEDHYPEGGLYEAICGSGVVVRPTYSLAVRNMPKTGKPQELLEYEEIDATALVKKIRSLISSLLYE